MYVFGTARAMQGGSTAQTTKANTQSSSMNRPCHQTRTVTCCPKGLGSSAFRLRKVCLVFKLGAKRSTAVYCCYPACSILYNRRVRALLSNSPAFGPLQWGVKYRRWCYRQLRGSEVGRMLTWSFVMEREREKRWFRGRCALMYVTRHPSGVGVKRAPRQGVMQEHAKANRGKQQQTSLLLLLFHCTEKYNFVHFLGGFAGFWLKIHNIFVC